MFPESLWIIKVSYICASVLISPGTATYQGTHSHFYPLCMQMHYRNMCVLHPSGTSSETFQPETVFKILISISETLLEYGRNLIKLSSIYISKYSKFSKIIECLKFLSFRKVIGEQISWLFSNLPYFYIFKFVCKCPLCIPTFHEKLKKLGSFETSFNNNL